MTRCSRTTTRRSKQMDEQFAQTLKHLGLRGVLSHWDEYVRLAEQQDYSPVRWLRHVLEEESRLHDENSRRLRLLRAKIPDPSKEHLHTISFCVRKKKQMTAFRVHCEAVAYDPVQTIKSLPHVDGAGGHVDASCRAKSKHSPIP